MARKFQIKRGLKAGMPTLAQGELAMTTDSGSEGLFIGTGTENIELARKSDLDAIPTPDVSGQINTHNADSSAHSDIRESITTHTSDTSIHVTADQKTAWDAKATTSYVDQKISEIPTPDVSGQISTHNTNTEAHNDIRKLITGLTNRLNALADSDDTTLDQLSEIVAYIKSNRSLIDGITTSKVNVSDIIDNLTTNVTNKPLSAAQGVALKTLIDAITVPTKVSELTNDSGYLTSYTETDPTVPAWAKAASKPTYTASEVGADPSGSASQALTDAKSYTDTQIAAIPTPDVSGQINTHNSDSSAHSDIRESITTHTGDTSIHVTSEEKTAWNAKADAPFKPAGKSYLTFSSPNSFTLKVNNTTKHWNGTLEYFASNKTWTTWDGTTTLSSANNDGEHVLYLRGTGNTVITVNNTGYKWVLTGSDIKCIGNIENLLDYATVASGAHPTMADNCYSYMFNGCTGLTQAPALPATTLASSCYNNMFSGCTSLTQAPALPATTLAADCYQNMFNGCTSLTQAPALPATTLANYCYSDMFYGCTRLTQVPALPATTSTSADYCYRNMFYGCRSLKLSSTQTGEYTVAYRIPATGTGTIYTTDVRNMFSGTGGTFKGTPNINTTYYLSNTNTVV